MNKKRRNRLHKLAMAVEKAIEFYEKDGIIVYNPNMENMVLNGKPFGTMTWHDEGDHSPNMDTYKWCPPAGYTVHFIGDERHSQCSYYLIRGNGKEFCVTDNADYSPSDVFDKLEIIDFKDIPNFILARLGRQ